MVARGGCEAALEGLAEEDLGQLGVGEGQCPQTEIGGGVGDGAEHELDGLDELMHEYLAWVMLLVRVIVLLDSHNSRVFLGSVDLRLTLRLQFLDKQLLMLVLLMAIQTLDLNDGLRQQHHRHTNHSDQQDNDLDGVLA